ncbi:MAG: hypothetical protein K9L23_20440 [Desulfotignum sp.]|nr:hypothetical protein [Desulfotignum sp.]
MKITTHIDQIGQVPNLIDTGFYRVIICTPGTKALLLTMLRDAMSFSDRTVPQIRVMEKQINDLSWGFALYETFGCPATRPMPTRKHCATG